MPAASPPPRALRAALAVAAAVLVGAGAHTLGGGTVDVAAAAWTFAALAAPAWWLIGRERGWASLAVAQLVGQQLVHLTLTSLAGDAHVHGALPADLMLYAHLLAAALTGAWLRLGERRAWAAARQARDAVAVLLARLIALAGTPQVVATPARPAPPPVIARRPGALLRHTLARRGPPLPA